MKTHRILVPLDGSPESETAIDAVLPMARAAGAELDLLRVMDRPDIPPRVGPALLRMTEILWLRGVTANSDLRIGDPREEILACARERQVDMIAMASHGRSGLSRMLVGSVTEDVLRRAEVPVFVCRPGKPLRPIERILVALDGSERAEDILHDVTPVAWRMRAHVDVVRVAHPIIAAAGMAEAPIMIEPEDPLPYLKKVVADLEMAGVKARAIPLEGAAGEQILRHAIESGTDLIAMTTHGRRGLMRLLLGSVAEEVLRHAPCPVLLRRMAVRVEAKP